MMEVKQIMPIEPGWYYDMEDAGQFDRVLGLALVLSDNEDRIIPICTFINIDLSDPYLKEDHMARLHYYPNAQTRNFETD